MNSDVSWNIEDWSYGYSKFSFVITGTNYILKYIKMENCCFDQINEALKRILSKKIKWPQNLCYEAKGKKGQVLSI